MDYVTLNNGVKMPQLGYGVYQTPTEETESCVLTAIKNGYRSIDTAQAYGNEEGVGQAIVIPGIILSPEGAVCLPDRIPVSDERNPVNGGIRPYRIADHIDGHISLSGDDLQARFLDGISKKIVPLDPADIFVIGLFLLLTGRMDHQDTGDIFYFSDIDHFQTSKRISAGNFDIHPDFSQDFIVVAVGKCPSLVIQYEVDPVCFHCSVEFFMTSDHDMLYFGRTRKIR